MTTIHLVGLCNDNPMLQQYLGCLSKRDFKTYEMVLNNFENRSSVVVNGNHYVFKDWCYGEGLTIRKESDGTWHFTTGLNCRSSGSSGILANGGPEMEQFYKSLIGEGEK